MEVGINVILKKFRQTRDNNGRAKERKQFWDHQKSDLEENTGICTVPHHNNFLVPSDQPSWHSYLTAARGPGSSWCARQPSPSQTKFPFRT